MRSDEEAGGLGEGLTVPSLGPSGQGQGIGHQANRRIGTHLRALYDSVLQQPIPERFVDLIARLGDDPSETNPDEARHDGARDAV